MRTSCCIFTGVFDLFLVGFVQRCMYWAARVLLQRHHQKQAWVYRRTVQLTFIIIAALILLVGAAYVVMIGYDISVRKYLSNKRRERLAKREAGDV